MSKIKIKNFGPIRCGLPGDGWIDINKITVFIGNQGSGKSSVAKLISIFSWIEKVLIRGDFNINHFTYGNRFRNRYCSYHRIESYFHDKNKNDITEIEYQGDQYHFTYKNGKLQIEQLPNVSGELTQVVYIPAERNFVSNIKNPKIFKEFSTAVTEFVGVFDIAKKAIKESIALPINYASVEYDSLNDIVNIKGDGYKVRLTESSSGFQSITPLYLVSKHFATQIAQSNNNSDSQDKMNSEESARFKEGVAQIWNNKDLSFEQQSMAISVLAKRFKKTAFINIVEEPEQNLFPLSQRDLLFSLIEFNNLSQGNKLIMTTHSPFIVNYLKVAALANEVKEQCDNELKNIFPLASKVNKEDISIYELDEKGSILPIKTYRGFPVDANYLNET